MLCCCKDFCVCLMERGKVVMCLDFLRVLVQGITQRCGRCIFLGDAAPLSFLSCSFLICQLLLARSNTSST